MITTTLEAGAAVVVTDVFGEEHDMVALTGIETKGHNFPIVWVGDPRREGQRIPWPVESVRLADVAEESVKE